MMSSTFPRYFPPAVRSFSQSPMTDSERESTTCSPYFLESPARYPSHHSNLCRITGPVLFRSPEGSLIFARPVPPHESIALSGGGARGVGFIGGIQALEEFRYPDGKSARDKILNVAGTSIGAVTAAAIAAGLSSEKLEHHMRDLNFKELLGKKIHGLIKRDGLPLFHFLDAIVKEGISDYFERHTEFKSREEVKPIFAKLNTDLEITFGDLAILHNLDPAVFKNLHVKAYCIGKKQEVTFGPETTPNVGVALACRASSSLPNILKHTKIPSHLLENVFAPEPGVETYSFVDGGMVDNIPTEVFESENRTQIVGDHNQNLKTMVWVFDEEISASGQSRFDNFYLNAKKFGRSNPVVRFATNAAIRLNGIQLDEKYTTATSRGLNNIRLRHPFLSVPFQTDHVRIASFHRAKKHYDHLVKSGHDTLSAHMREYFGSDFGNMYYEKFENLESFLLSITQDELCYIYENQDRYAEVLSACEQEKLKSIDFQRALFHFKEEFKSDVKAYFDEYSSDLERNNSSNIKNFLSMFVMKLNEFRPKINEEMKSYVFDFVLKQLQKEIFKYDPGSGARIVLKLLNFRINEKLSQTHQGMSSSILKILRAIYKVQDNIEPANNEKALEKIILIAEDSRRKSSDAIENNICNAILKLGVGNKIAFFESLFTENVNTP